MLTPQREKPGVGVIPVTRTHLIDNGNGCLGGRLALAYDLQRYRRSGSPCGVATSPLSGAVLSCIWTVDADCGGGLPVMAVALGLMSLVGAYGVRLRTALVSSQTPQPMESSCNGVP